MRSMNTLENTPNTPMRTSAGSKVEAGEGQSKFRETNPRGLIQNKEVLEQSTL